MPESELNVDYESAVGQVRLLIPDTEALPNPADPLMEPEPIFTDEQLQAYLGLNAGNVRLAAADALAALGTSEALVSKVIQTEDLKTDGAKMMGQFLARAKMLREQSDNAGLDVNGGIEIVPDTTFVMDTRGCYRDQIAWGGSWWL